MLPGIMEQLEMKFLTKPVRFEGLQRIEELEYPVAALREMLLNALVHRNYQGSMTQMKVYDNRLTLWNAGSLPEELSIEQLFQAHESIPRNPLLAEVCYKAGYIDSWGRGVEKISEACSQAGLQAPVFTERTGGVLVELLRTGSDKIGDATQKTTHKTTHKTVSTAQKIVAVLREAPQSSRREIAESLAGITEDGVKYHLAKLKKAGTIRRIGADKGGHWEVIDE